MKIIKQEARDINKIKQRIKSLIESLKVKQHSTLIIELSSLCNLSCSFCDFHSGKIKNLTDQKGIMDEKLYYKIIDDIVNMGYKFKALYYHGWGEPLIQKNAIKMINYACKKNVANSHILITNGTLMTETAFDEILESGITEIRISLDTVDPDEYIKLKGKDLIHLCWSVVSQKHRRNQQ